MIGKKTNNAIPPVTIVETFYAKNEEKTIDGVSFSRIKPKLNTVLCSSVGLGFRVFVTSHIFLSGEGKAMFGSKSSFEHNGCYVSEKEGNAAPVITKQAPGKGEEKLKFRDYSMGCTLGYKF
ncbi:hypothetical protein AGMMS49949_09760 [Alphaproteobacteria bacterium]|nr:hypothetical protein AGMMS49949_09760 [Alphaproteobacteria bacterium]GHT00736.1 hypothetical protein AGMMS50296_9040 [Alphaproteobacteria bacterium]